MVTEIADTQEAVREKSMAALAELLRGDGVYVSQTVEHDVLNGRVHLPRILFDCAGEAQALEIADTVLAHGYPLARLKRKWYYDETGHHYRPDWVMDFRTSLTE